MLQLSLINSDLAIVHSFFYPPYKINVIPDK